MDAAKSGTAVLTDGVLYAVTMWLTLEGHHAPPLMGDITDALRATLRDLAESDARLYRGLATELADTPATRPALPADDIAAAIALLEAAGYTVTPPQG